MKIVLSCKRRGKDMKKCLGKTAILINDSNVLKRCWKILTTKAIVYHTDNTYLEGLIAGIKAWLTGRISTVLIRGKDYLLHMNERHGLFVSVILQLIEPLTLRLTSKVFFVSHDTKKLFVVEYPFIKNKSKVIFNGVDYDKFSSGKKIDLHKTFPRIRPKDKVLIFVSNFKYKEKAKGAKLVINAMKYLPNNVKLLICGNGKWLNLIKIMAIRARLDDRIIFAGFRNDLPGLLKSSDLFVYSSFLDGFPTSVLEAQCAGLPVVTNDKDGIPETIAPYGGFAVKTSCKMAKKVKYFLNNPLVKKSCGNTAQSYMFVWFSWYEIMQDYLIEWRLCYREKR